MAADCYGLKYTPRLRVGRVAILVRDENCRSVIRAPECAKDHGRVKPSSSFSEGYNLEIAALRNYTDMLFKCTKGQILL